MKYKLKDAVSDNVRSIASFNNPVDLTGSATDENFVACAKIMGASDEIDCIVFLLLPYIPAVTLDIGVKLSHVCKKYKKPIIVYVPHIEKYNMMIDGFELIGIPASSSIEGYEDIENIGG